MIYYEGTPVFADFPSKEYDHWRWNLRHHTSKMEPESQSRGGSEMTREMKVGDKLLFVGGDKPMYEWIGAKPCQVFEVIAVDGCSSVLRGFRPRNKHTKSNGCYLCVGSTSESYKPGKMLTQCDAWKVIN